MSLKKGIGKLRIEDQRAAGGEVERGTDPGIFGGERKVQFEAEKREEIYGWISRTLQVNSYGRQNRVKRGLLRS